MRHRQILHLKHSLNCNLKIRVKDGQLGTTRQELNKLIQLLLVIGLQNLPQPLNYDRGLSVAFSVLDMGLDDIDYRGIR